MDNKYYFPDLGIDGTADELITWAWRYSDDYSDEALQKISEIAGGENNPKAKVPLLVLEDRHKEANALPYANMKADYILNGYGPSYSETKEYGELEIRREGDFVLLSVMGQDDTGFFTAANKYTMDEFMSDDPSWLESQVGSTLFYGKVYEEAEEAGTEPEEKILTEEDAEKIADAAASLTEYGSENSTGYFAIWERGETTYCADVYKVKDSVYRTEWYSIWVTTGEDGFLESTLKLDRRELVQVLLACASQISRNENRDSLT